MNFFYKHMYGSWYERRVILPIVVPIGSVSSSTPQYLIVGEYVMTEERASELMEGRKDAGKATGN